jgi:hypothetical protein
MPVRHALIIALGVGTAAITSACGNNTAKDVPIDLAAIGNVEAFVTNSVRSQVTGQLVEVAFHEGDLVQQGELLFTPIGARSKRRSRRPRPTSRATRRWSPRPKRSSVATRRTPSINS